ncbi:MAG: cardiolipin synthase [Clostridia bacterium]|nr:cardiolipin synthase [Clostridia bacterium]
MKRKLKKIFSRFPLIMLTITLMFLFAIAVFAGAIYVVEEVLIYYYPEADIYLQIGFATIDWFIILITALRVANRDMVPETKVPWLICIIVFNIVGVIAYFTFSSHRPTKKQRARYLSLIERSIPYSKRKFTKQETENLLGSWADESEALALASPMAVLYGGTKTEYLSSGEVFLERLLEDLEKAEKFIFLEFFIIEKGKLWGSVLDILKRKVAEGVEVRVMYDDIGCMGKVHLRYHKTLRKLGIKCVKFNPFVPVVSNVHNNRDHRKIVVIDGKIGYTGGINLADEYANMVTYFGHWKDTAVRLEGEAVKSFTLMFLRLYNIQKKSAEDFSKYIPEEFEYFEDEGFVQPYGDGPRPLYGKHLGEDVYINLLNGAKRYVYIATPYLIIDYRLRETLILTAQRGVDVRILTPHIPDKKLPFALTRSNYLALIKGGVKIYEYTPGFVHAKMFVCDDEVAVVGTINLDYRSLLFHFEDAVLLYHSKAVLDIKEDMEKTFEVSALQTAQDAKKSVVWRWLCEFAKLFAPLF